MPIFAIGGAVLDAIMVIVGWFGTGGAIASFFAWFATKMTTKAMAVAWQVVTIISLFASRVAFAVAVYSLSTTLINYFNDFLNQLPTLMSSSELLDIGFKLMQSIGLIDALLDAFSVFNVCIVAIGVAYLAKFAFKTLEITSNEYFKLSVLLQQ